MFLADLPNVLLRWWYVVVAGVVCTIALAALTTKFVPPTYHATAEVLLLPPSTAVPKGGNPYLALGGLDAIGGVLSTALTDAKTAADLKALGSSGEYTVGLDQLSPAPMLVVTADERTEEQSLDTVQQVLDRMPGVLRAIQVSAAVPDDSFITTTLITRSEKAEAQHKSQLRAVLVVVAGGLLGTLMVTALLNALFPRSRRRRPVVSNRPRPARQGATATTGVPDAAEGAFPSPVKQAPTRRLRVPARRPASTVSGEPSTPRPSSESPLPHSDITSTARPADDDQLRSEYSTRGG